MFPQDLLIDEAHLQLHVECKDLSWKSETDFGACLELVREHVNQFDSRCAARDVLLIHAPALSRRDLHAFRNYVHTRVAAVVVQNCGKNASMHFLNDQHRVVVTNCYTTVTAENKGEKRIREVLLLNPSAICEVADAASMWMTATLINRARIDMSVWLQEDCDPVIQDVVKELPSPSHGAVIRRDEAMLREARLRRDEVLLECSRAERKLEVLTVKRDLLQHHENQAHEIVRLTREKAKQAEEIVRLRQQLANTSGEQDTQGIHEMSASKESGGRNAKNVNFGDSSGYGSHEKSVSNSEPGSNTSVTEVFARPLNLSQPGKKKRTALDNTSQSRNTPEIVNDKMDKGENLSSVKSAALPKVALTEDLHQQQHTGGGHDETVQSGDQDMFDNGDDASGDHLPRTPRYEESAETSESDMSTCTSAGGQRRRKRRERVRAKHRRRQRSKPMEHDGVTHSTPKDDAEAESNTSEDLDTSKAGAETDTTNESSMNEEEPSKVDGDMNGEEPSKVDGNMNGEEASKVDNNSNLPRLSQGRRENLAMKFPPMKFPPMKFPTPLSPEVQIIHGPVPATSSVIPAERPTSSKKRPAGAEPSGRKGRHALVHPSLSVSRSSLSSQRNSSAPFVPPVNRRQFNPPRPLAGPKPAQDKFAARDSDLSMAETKATTSALSKRQQDSSDDFEPEQEPKRTKVSTDTSNKPASNVPSGGNISVCKRSQSLHATSAVAKSDKNRGSTKATGTGVKDGKKEQASHSLANSTKAKSAKRRLKNVVELSSREVEARFSQCESPLLEGSVMTVDAQASRNNILDLYAYLESSTVRKTFIYNQQNPKPQMDQLLRDVDNTQLFFFEVLEAAMNKTAVLVIFTEPNNLYVLFFDDKVGLHPNGFYKDVLSRLFCSTAVIKVANHVRANYVRAMRLMGTDKKDLKVLPTQYVEARHFVHQLPRMYQGDGDLSPDELECKAKALHCFLVRLIPHDVRDEYNARSTNKDRVFTARAFRKRNGCLQMSNFDVESEAVTGKGLHTTIFTREGVRVEKPKSNFPATRDSIRIRYGSDVDLLEDTFFWDALIPSKSGETRQEQVINMLLVEVLFAVNSCIYYTLCVHNTGTVTSVGDMWTGVHAMLMTGQQEIATGANRDPTGALPSRPQLPAKKASFVVYGNRVPAAAIFAQDSYPVWGEERYSTVTTADHFASLTSTYAVENQVIDRYADLITAARRANSSASHCYIASMKDGAETVGRFAEYGEEEGERADTILKETVAAWKGLGLQKYALMLFPLVLTLDNVDRKFPVLVRISNLPKSPKIQLKILNPVRTHSESEADIQDLLIEVEDFAMILYKEVLAQKRSSLANDVEGKTNGPQTLTPLVTAIEDPMVFLLIQMRNAALVNTDLGIMFKEAVHSEAMIRAHVFRECMEQRIKPLDLDTIKHHLTGNRFFTCKFQFPVPSDVRVLKSDDGLRNPLAVRPETLEEKEEWAEHHASRIEERHMDISQAFWVMDPEDSNSEDE